MEALGDERGAGSWTRPALRWGAGIASVLALAASVGVVVVLWNRPDMTALQKWNYASVIALTAPLAATALLVALRGASNAGAAMLGFAMAAAAMTDALAALVDQSLGDGGALAQAPLRFAFFLAAGAFIRASQTFPRTITADDLVSDRAPWLRAPWLRALLRFNLRPWVPWLWSAAAAATVGSPYLALPGQLCVVLLGAAYLHVRLRIGDDQERRQVSWFLQAALLAAILGVVGTAFSAILDSTDSEAVRPFVAISFNYLSSVAIVGCIYMAVFRAGAVNPDLIIRGTLVYGAAASLLLFAINVVLSVAVDSVVEIAGVSDRFLAGALGGLAGLAFEPLSRRLKALLDRFAPKAPERGNISPI